MMMDNKLLDKYFIRDETAIEDTKKIYGRMIRSSIKRILSDDCDIEECENDVYLKIWQLIPPDRPCDFGAYLCKLAKNIAFKAIRRKKAAKRNAEFDLSYEELEENIIGRSSDPEESLNAKELSRIVDAFLRNRAKEKRVMFIKRYWYYERIKDIADELHVSETKVSTTLARMRKELQKELVKQGYEVR